MRVAGIVRALSKESASVALAQQSLAVRPQSPGRPLRFLSGELMPPGGSGTTAVSIGSNGRRALLPGNTQKASPNFRSCDPSPYGGMTSTTRIVVGSTSTTRFCATVYLVALASGAVASARSGKK